MPKETRISLKAARTNAGMTQEDAAKALTEYFGMKISRQRVMAYESAPSTPPPGFGQAFATIYKMPIDAINFAR